MAQRALLIAGPTASGKTAYAIERAKPEGALIINTDSMQIYPVLRVLTARPSDEELARFAETRSARAFMLLGRVTGMFD